MFKDMLGSEESLFKNEVALSYDYIPKVVPYRENSQRYIASCIKPLFQQRNGKNLLLYGPPGIGKTVATKHLFQEIEEETEDVDTIYINGWQKNSTYKIMLEICDVLGYKFTQNKKSDELFAIIKQMLNKKSVVFCFDEIDKVEDFDFVYWILEEIYRKTILLITNLKEWHQNLDQRIRSRLMLDFLEFKPYTKEETEGILKQRIEVAFMPNVFDKEILDLIIKKTTDLKDIRSGLYLLKESATIAENRSQRKVNLQDAQESLQKLDDFKTKDSNDLDDDCKLILDLIKDNSNKKIGDIFKLYQRANGKDSYRNFQRKIEKLEKGNFISTQKIEGGSEGKTTILNYITEKKLTDY